MFFVLECFTCGCPIGYLAYGFEYAVYINKAKNAQQVIKLLKEILEKYKKQQEEVQDFILTSIQHLDCLQILDLKKAINNLLIQYFTIYPNKTMKQDLQNNIKNDQQIQKFFEQLRLAIKDKNPYTEDSKQNILKQFMQDNYITRMCCRNSILTFVDFYHTKNSF